MEARSLPLVLGLSGSSAEKAGNSLLKMCFSCQMLLYDSYLWVSSQTTTSLPLSKRRHATYVTNLGKLLLMAPEKDKVYTTLLTMTPRMWNVLSFLMLLLIWLLRIVGFDTSTILQSFEWRKSPLRYSTYPLSLKSVNTASPPTRRKLLYQKLEGENEPK